MQIIIAKSIKYYVEKKRKKKKHIILPKLNFLGLEPTTFEFKSD